MKLVRVEKPAGHLNAVTDPLQVKLNPFTLAQGWRAPGGEYFECFTRLGHEEWFQLVDEEEAR